MKRKILFTDDDQDLVRSFQVILQSKGYEVLTASSGKEAVERLSLEKPDLLVLDIMMDSNLDGLNNLHKIKENPETKNTPVIVLTGMIDELGVNLRSAAEDLENVVFYNKPVNPQTLIEQIEQMLN